MALITKRLSTLRIDHGKVLEDWDTGVIPLGSLWQGLLFLWIALAHRSPCFGLRPHWYLVCRLRTKAISAARCLQRDKEIMLVSRQAVVSAQQQLGHSVFVGIAAKEALKECFEEVAPEIFAGNSFQA